MRVRVSVDVSRPLCRGRKVAFAENKEGWVSFQYERLPNLCFWCGLLLHDDKDCELWLKSKGTLPLERQQCGHWIKASVFSTSKCQDIEVKEFDESHGRSQRSQPPTNVSNRVTEVASNPLVPLLLEGEDSGSVPVTELETVLPVVNSEDVHPNVASGVIIGPSSNVNQPADFEAIIGEIDEALEDNAPISNSLDAEVIHEIQEKSSNVLGGFKGSDKQVMGIASDRSPENEEVAGFSVGWAEMADKKKIVKAGKGKATKKGKS